MEGLSKLASDGIVSTCSALKELEEQGYLVIKSHKERRKSQKKLIRGWAAAFIRNMIIIAWRFPEIWGKTIAYRKKIVPKSILQ